MKKIVLDQFGSAWGYADVKDSTKTIEVFSEKTIDGTPVNAKIRKVSSAKKFEEQLKKNSDYEVFVKYEHSGQTYYRY